MRRRSLRPYLGYLFPVTQRISFRSLHHFYSHRERNQKWKANKTFPRIHNTLSFPFIIAIFISSLSIHSHPHSTDTNEHTVHRSMDPPFRAPFSLSNLYQTLPLGTCCAIFILWAVHHILSQRYAPITITGPTRREEVGAHGETTEELVHRWCKSLKEGFTASWWLPKYVMG